MKRLAFCNNNGGGGKSTLVFHLAHMLADLRQRSLLVDLDPQSSLTAMCVPEERLEALWPDEPGRPDTIAGALASAGEPHVELLRDGLGLLPGDIRLSVWEEPLSAAWLRAPTSDESATRAIVALLQAIELAAQRFAADVVLINVGPNLGAINRTALAAADHVVMPLAPDPFAIQGLHALGPTLAVWRMVQSTWLRDAPQPELARLMGPAEPLGYVVMQAAMRLHRPATAYDRWLRRVPAEYHRSVLGDSSSSSLDDDPHCLGIMRHYHGLAVLARDSGKPMFHLKPADGAIGSNMAAVIRCREDFESLARALLDRAGLSA